MGLAIVTRIPSYAEAQIAAGALRSAGIAAEVFDGAYGQIEAPVVQALGGFRVMAPEHEIIAARDILRALQSGPGLGEAGDHPERPSADVWPRAPALPAWRRWLSAAAARFARRAVR